MFPMVNPVALGIGLALIIGGVCGILFVTIPSVYAIGNGVQGAVEGDASGVGGAVIGGILLYFTTGLFIFLIIIGFIITVIGIADN